MARSWPHKSCGPWVCGPPGQDPDVAADHRFAVVGRPGGELVDRLGLRRLVALDLDRFVDGEIGVAAARPDLQRAVHSRHARGLVIDDQDRRHVVMLVQPISGVDLLDRRQTWTSKLKAVLFDLVEPAFLEGIRTNDDHPVDFAGLVQEREFGQGE